MYVLSDAKAWFKVHPRTKVIYHHRWDDLSPASRERLSMPRNVEIRGHRACFSDGSELMLRTNDNTSRVGNGLLDILDGAGSIIVTYAACNEG